MEEDINILDEVVGRSKELREKDFVMLIGTKQMQSIENLIKGYRELKKEIEILREYIIIAPNLDEMTALKYAHIQESAYFKGRAEEQQKAEQIIYEHYIPKSKVKELEAEIEKKDKIIDLMTQQLIFYDERLLINNYQSEYEIKKIFIDKVEKEKLG